MITQRTPCAPAARSVQTRVYYAPASLVATWLTARERQRVDLLANAPLVRLRHHDELTTLRSDLSDSTSSTALISTALTTEAHVAQLSLLIRKFPEITFVGLLMDSGSDATSVSGIHALGLAGVSRLVDSRAPNGLATLRTLLHPENGAKPFTHKALDELAADLGIGRVEIDSDTPEVAPNTLRFFAAVFAQRYRSIRELADALGIHASTLISRFFRARLPSPRRYLIHARLAWAAHLAEHRWRTATEIAMRLQYSSPQSFARTVRMCTGLTFTQFRKMADGETMLTSFRESLVLPFRDALRRFDPLKPT